MIEIKNIYLKIEDKEIFKNFSVKISKNEHVCFSGHSGKGKSTLLKIIQGYVIPQNGIIQIDGKILNPENVKSLRNLMSYIPQNVNLPVENLYELINFIGAKNYEEKIFNILEILKINKKEATKPFDQLSGGEKQRLIIACCLSLNKQIILMDEPTSGLDNESSNIIIELVKNLKNNTIISVSHNPLWCKSCDKIIEL
ncbi:MAG TPA: ABC transporter ATP-binding protein [Bacteroidales bacterium]|jgi:polar amino acid transport system ATP-binding protein/putative ABC transport system ATP-binding protein|nr:ABC transporter ATP-binding protein [Bacteroidales bacterium]HRT80216.1 ABC transporter ATP-binding protein [Bacteroidales bacterium]